MADSNVHKDCAISKNNLEVGTQARFYAALQLDLNYSPSTSKNLGQELNQGIVSGSDSARHQTRAGMEVGRVVVHRFVAHTNSGRFCWGGNPSRCRAAY